MSEPVRAARAAIVAGVLAALFVVVLYQVKPVPDWAIAMFGGPGRPIDRYGGLSLTFKPDAGQEAAFAAYIADRGQVARREGGLVVVDFPGLSEDAAMETTDLLTYGGLVMKEVVDGTYYATQIGETEDVKIDVDQWRPEDGGPLRTDLYLVASTAEAMQAAVAGYQPPAGTELAYEWVEPPTYAKGARPFLRTYLVKSEVAIDGALIADAMGSYEPSTNRPIVLLDFNDEGAEKFAELTARITGGKLATIVGGRVRSAPVINGAIRGGRASITMGGSDPMQQERERDALVAVLRTGTLPAGTIEHQQWKPAADVSSEAWKARGLFGALTGIVLGLLVLALVRLTKPTLRAQPRVEGSVPWRRIAVTALAPIALIVGSYVTLPGVNYVELEHIVTRGGGGEGMDVSVFALGLLPLVTAFVLVELVALVVPRLRWRRHDPRGRIGLGRAVAALAIVLALAQAYLFARQLESLSLYGANVVSEPGLGFHVLVMVTLATGTMLLALVAGLIRERGLGNGYAALITAAFVLGFENVHHDVTKSTLLGLVGAIGIAAATRALLRWRISGLRLPTSGVAPLADTGGLLVSLATLALLLDEALWIWFERANDLRASIVVNAIILLVAVPVWSWLFARPRLVEGTTLHGWVRATAATLVFVGGGGLVGLYTAGVDRSAFAILAPLSVMLATATVLDIKDELLARRQALVPVGIVHQAQYVAVLERAFDEAGIPAHFHASHVRALLAFFGPWAPIIVLVPDEHAAAARTKVYETVTTEHHEVARAFARVARPIPAPRLVPASARTS